MIDLLFLIAGGIAVAFFIVLFLWLVGHDDWTIWHGAVFGLVAGLVAIALEHYVNLFDWIYVGISGTDLGASLFVIGMGMMIAVMGFNLLQTGGRTAVR